MSTTRVRSIVGGMASLFLAAGLFLPAFSLPVVAETTATATTSTTATGPISADDTFGDLDTGAQFADIAGLGSQDLATTIASIIRVALGFLGVIAVVIILYGGLKWMTAGGDDPKIKKAQGLIFAGITGLVIVLAAYAIASFVIGSITTAVAG